MAGRGQRRDRRPTENVLDTEQAGLQEFNGRQRRLVKRTVHFRWLSICEGLYHAWSLIGQTPHKPYHCQSRQGAAFSPIGVRNSTLTNLSPHAAPFCPHRETLRWTAAFVNSRKIEGLARFDGCSRRLAMTTESTIPEAIHASGAHDMSRTRRRGGKDGGHGGQASTLSSIVNLLNTIVGAGTLAMPSVLSHMGIMLGVVLILWSGVTAAFGLYLQSRCSRYLDRGTSSFFALSQITYPNASVIFDLAIAVKCFGVAVSYMIIIGDLMPGVMLGFNDAVADIPYLVDRHFWVTAFMLLIIPLSFLRRLDSLKYTSLVALVSIGYLIVLVIYHFAADSHADPEDIRVIKWAGPVETLSALPVVVFAYTCHQNASFTTLFYL
ncbi:hypothetical protein L249_0839 [Ophiocordyceps polyrhachis-furcata BCC 54312]|uniref:Amino acid transporter transmembrane domain-containing protein n=1 Tax=Ophiocordyceps polyrhachis-furcata BCC 54312 TaxID=1330021 RepID=A0A367LDQ8_9HYPO|nr:hypothetical protein L249_0839 [Ophiocordyceps polyrhachis-furcata BCC 54312]